jgi:CPA1 family monovalent cation:H+ antiporter
VCGLGLPAVMNAFYYNPNEETEGLKGFYQRLCHKDEPKWFSVYCGEMRWVEKQSLFIIQIFL